ncbi:glycosyl hydrolase 53 family protein [Paenibacillus harenae]|uniref:glycosyl hydrolase 53 family protein n=1 Tax=Paenibacillus harenae TaxID=306543 RepID=UPI0004128DF3|nr:glycosyl hydrolase 53 family protein [Paenibacillus harenae]
MRAWVQKGLSALLAILLTLTTLVVSEPREQAYAAAPSDPDTFIKGVDISTLQAIEAKGIKYYDLVNGQRQEKELLAILKEHGVNYVRLRVWNNPMHSDGFNDADHLITMAQRVKAADMKLLVDFHYSDFWADPGQQAKPEAWKNLTFPELKQAVYDYTAEVMNGLKAVNAYPDMVQIGNEINNGMMLPDGSTSQFAKLAELLKEGVSAVRETTPDGQTTKIMIHLAEGGDNHKFRNFFDQVEVHEVDYDVIGMSYYPYWHGTFQQLKTNMDDMAARYGKQVVVAETAYPHTLEDVDGPGNIAGADQVRIAGFEATPENQQLVTELVMNTVAHVQDNKGLGIFYWEPAWLAGVGWKTGEGNGWENQAMFDFDGNALSSLNAFKFTPDSNAAKLPVMVYASPAITIAKGAMPSLPATAGVLYNEGSISNTAVTWDAIAEGKLNKPGKFTLEGTVTGLNQKASIEITVLANPNLVQNEGFESGNLTHWSLTGTENSGKIAENAGNAHSGTYAFNYWNGSNYTYQLTQTVTGLENGTYTLKAWSSGGGGETKLKLFGGTAGGTTLSTDVVNTGYNVWKQYTVPNIVVTNGQAKIGFDVEAPAGTWGYFDDIELVKEEPSSVPGSFAKGADISWLPQLEALGYKFYNDNLEEQDLLQILKDHGIDCIRIRAWVDPSDDPSNGHSSTEEVVALSSRVSALGFRVMIDLHYSDSWADPGKQITPAAWANDNLDQLKVHVSEYTSEVMNALKEAGVTPEWVQIGNEINNGMMHPLGAYSNTSNLVQLIQAGSSAAKAVFPDIKVIIHRSSGAEAGVDSFYAGLVAAGLQDSDYDIIGLSYYPDSVFTSSINELSENMNKLAEKYRKEVMIVEVGGDVAKDADSVHNMLVAVQNKLHAVPNDLGTGVFYWAPEGIYFGYPNSAWDPDGTPSLALDAFIDGAVEINRHPVQSIALDKHTNTIEVGAAGKLTANINPTNATYKGVTFTSSNPEVVKVDPYSGIISGLSVGTATISVVTYDGGYTDSSEVIVVPSSSLIQNSGFEKGLDSWTITGDTSAVSTDIDVHSGTLALHYWSANPAEFTASQTITGLENGKYTLSAWVSGGGGEEVSEIFAGSTTQSFTNTGWREWSKPTLDNIEVTDGTLTVGAHYKLSGGQWGNIDDFVLVKTSDAPGTQDPPASGDNGNNASGSGTGEINTLITGNTTFYSVMIKTTTDMATDVTTAKLESSVITDLVQKAKESEAAGQKVVIDIKIDTAADEKSVNIVIPKEGLKPLVDTTKADLRVDAGIAAITFDPKAVAAIGSAAADNMISIKKLAKSDLPENVQNKIGDRSVFDFSVKAGNAEITEFNGGTVKISVPYTPMTSEKKNAIVVYYIDKSGNLKPVRGGYDAATGKVNFQTTHFSNYAVGYNEVKFNDVTSKNWYSDAVGYLAAREIANGVGGSTFAPEKNVTRADFLMMVMDAYGIETDAAINDNFSDAGNKYYTEYLGTARKLGLVSGVGGNKFMPEATISRQDMSVILFNILKQLDELPSGKNGKSYERFVDTAAVAGYAKDAMKLLVEAGMIDGNGNELDPKATATRAQVAQIVYNCIK